jgi:deoxyribodipyrimidine photo-lyase
MNDAQPVADYQDFADFAPTLEAAMARIAAVRPADYARSRNAIDGAVSQLSPYITHGFVSLSEVLAGVASRYPLDRQHKFVFELGWRAYFRHVWQHRGSGILTSLHQGVLPDQHYAMVMPTDIRQGCTGVPVIDRAVHTLYTTGTLHNHARMWLASYLVHIRKVHWRAGADWLYGHLLDGDLASNHLSWQWVAGTGSSKPYLFNADNVARFAPALWHSPGSVIDTSYEELDRLARQPGGHADRAYGQHNTAPHLSEPTLWATPPADLALTAPQAERVKDRDVWLVHPWSLGPLPSTLPDDTLVVGVFVADFHRDWPWNARRWHFVHRRMAEIADVRWHGDAAALRAALQSARSVRCLEEPHLAPWLNPWVQCEPAPTLFAEVDPRCDSFSQWWTRVSRDKKKPALP